jgi:hypothetical protein
MKVIRPDQITMICMDCDREYVGSRPATAPASAALYVVHCGCKPQSTDPPFYVDGEGERMEHP